MQSRVPQIDIIEDIVVVGLDPDASLLQQQDRQILTSIQVVEKFQKPNIHYKLLQMTDGRFLKLGFNQKDYMPIIDIDIFQKTQGSWIPIVVPSTYQIFDEHIHVKVSRNWFFEKLIANVTIIQGGIQCSFWRQIQKIMNKIIKIPYTEDYLVLEFHEVKPITSYQFKPLILQQYPQNKKEQYLTNIPLFTFPFGIKLSTSLEPYKIHTVVLTQNQGIKLYCTCLIAMTQFQHYKSQMNNVLYYPKGYVIISRYQYTDCFIEFLQNIYVKISTQQTALKKIAQKAWQQFSNHTLNNEILAMQHPTVSERSFSCLFQMISINNIVKIFKALLLQKNVFFISSSKTVLGFIIEAFLSLLYPLNWQHPVIPIFLNQISQDVLDSPIPTIVGILAQNFKTKYQKFGLVVYVDQNTLANSKMIDSLITLQDRILQRKLHKYSKYIPNTIQQFIASEQNPSFFKKSNIQSKFNISKLRNHFLNYMQELLKDYKKYIIPQSYSFEERQSIQTRTSQSCRTFREMFNIQQYRNKIKAQGNEFLEQFIQTALFTTFIQRNCNNNENPQLTFFNQSIESKHLHIRTKKTFSQQMIQTVSLRIFRDQNGTISERKRVLSTQYLATKIQLNQRKTDFQLIQNNIIIFPYEDTSCNNLNRLNQNEIKVNQKNMQNHMSNKESNNFDFEGSILSIEDNIQDNINDFLIDEQGETNGLVKYNFCNWIQIFSSCISTSGQNIAELGKGYCKKLTQLKKNILKPSTQNEVFRQEQ